MGSGGGVGERERLLLSTLTPNSKVINNARGRLAAIVSKARFLPLATARDTKSFVLFDFFE